MKIVVTVSKTVQERQYEPTSISIQWDGEVPVESAAEAKTEQMYHQLSDMVDQLLFERTGRKVRRS